MPSSSAPHGQRAPAAVATNAHMMPTLEELRRSSASVVLPDDMTGGVAPDEFLKYCMPLLHIVQTQKLTGDKSPQVDGTNPLAAAVAAFHHAFRVVDCFAMLDLVRDATLRPYTKVFTRAYLTVRCLFCYSFV